MAESACTLQYNAHNLQFRDREEWFPGRRQTASRLRKRGKKLVVDLQQIVTWPATIAVENSIDSFLPFAIDVDQQQEELGKSTGNSRSACVWFYEPPVDYSYWNPTSHPNDPHFFQWFIKIPANNFLTYLMVLLFWMKFPINVLAIKWVTLWLNLQGNP